MSPSPHQPQTILFPVNLGQASGFDRTLFPLSSHKKRDSLGRTDYYLDATLDEMLKITNIGANPEQLRKFIKTTKARYDQIVLRKAELEQRPKTWNPFKRFATYRALRLLEATSKSLHNQTKSRSDEMVRNKGWEMLISVPGTEVQSVEDDPSLDRKIGGIAVKLDGPLDDTSSQQLLNGVNTIVSYSCQFEGDEAASEASSILSQEYFMASESLTSLSESIGIEEDISDISIPTNSSTVTTITNNYLIGCIYSKNSSVIGGTTQLGGHSNSGSVNHNVKTASDMRSQSS